MNKILIELAKGRTISQYPTQLKGYTEYLRWDDTLEVVNCKSIVALKRKGYKIDITISDKIVKY